MAIVRPVEKQRANPAATVWKIFTAEENNQSYLTNGKH